MASKTVEVHVETEVDGVEIDELIDVDVDIELDEFDDDELIDALKDRLSEVELHNEFSMLHLTIQTLDDKMKFEYISEIFNKYSLAQFESALPK